MEMFEIYNGSQWAHDIFLVNKAAATEYITGQSYPLSREFDQFQNFITCNLQHVFYELFHSNL